MIGMSSYVMSAHTCASPSECLSSFVSVSGCVLTSPTSRPFRCSSSGCPYTGAQERNTWDHINNAQYV